MFLVVFVFCWICVYTQYAQNKFEYPLSDVSHLQALTTVVEANTYMVKARAIEKELGATSARIVARGRMECDMVDYVLGKLSKEEKDRTSLASISKTYVDQVAPNVDQVAPNVEPKVQTSAEDEYEPPAIFDPSANVAQQTFANYGWKLGAIVASNEIDKKKPTADRQFEIGFVNDDGGVGLHPILADGTVDKAFLSFQICSWLVCAFSLFECCYW